MPSNLVFAFPTRPAGSWTYPIQRSPQYSSVIKKSANGIEARTSLQIWPTWIYSFKIGYLKGSASAATAYRDLLGFYMAMGGAGNSFLYLDPDDNTVTPTGTDGSTAGFLGIGDGSTTTFQLIRQIGIGQDIVQNPITVTPYLNGTPQATGWTLGYGGIVTFASAPGNGVIVQWGGQFYFRLRFQNDVIDDLEMILHGVWDATIKLQSVLLPG